MHPFLVGEAGRATEAVVAGPITYSIPGFSDPVSSLTHLAGAATFAALTPRLLLRGGGAPWRVAWLAVFAFATVFLLSMSGTYHLLTPGTGGREVLRRLDHGAIFVLIAGTFTPLHGILFRGVWRWGPLLLIWALAAAGATLKSIFFHDLPDWIGLLYYLAMGWLGLISGTALGQRYGWRFIAPLVWGGVAYTVGGVCEFLEWPVLIAGVLGPHELFHVFVLAGAAFHWQFIFRFACGTLPPPRRPAPAGAGPPTVA